ncbi:MAG TPA: response regulator transcription factor [Actinomycetota bacterium]|jgi:two-component system response regulator NreC|nr:response regulator transcription factor [Actinomycetota bacterium]
MDGAAIDLFVFESDPVLEGVIRLAAAAAEGVGDVTVVTTIDVEIWSSLRPTIVVLDLAGGSDLSAVATIVDHAPLARVVVLSDRDDGPVVLEAMRRGVYGFVRKPDGLHELAETLTQIAAGERVVPPELERSAVDELRRFARQAHAASVVETSITAREREILALAAEGFTTHQIGRRLGISPRTVEAHIAKLYRKLGVKTRLQAVARAATLGLIDLDT